MASEPIWWFDRCLGRALPDAISALGADVRRYSELYPSDPTIADVDWIPRVSSLGWVIVTKDKNIRRDAMERDALRAAGARYVCLASARLTGQQQIDCLVEHWRTIEGVVRTRTPPLIVNVTLDGVSYLDGESWRKVKRKPPRSGA